MRKHSKADEQANQLEQQSEDPELWTQEPVQIKARPTRTSVLSLRLPTAEFHALLKAARSAGESVSEYVRKAIILRREHEQRSTPTVNVSYTYNGMPATVELQQWGTWTAGTPETELTLVP
jgi:hypothetical protein